MILIGVVQELRRLGAVESHKNHESQQSTGHFAADGLLLKESLSYPETYIIQMWYHVLYLETLS
jgi:hypothetical protein